MPPSIRQAVTRRVSRKLGVLPQSTARFEPASLSISRSTWFSCLFSLSTTTTPNACGRLVPVASQSFHYSRLSRRDFVAISSSPWSQSCRGFISSSGLGLEARKPGDGRQGDGAQEPLAAGKICKCWKCDSILSCRDFFCECGAPQSLEGRLDYFELLGCPRSVFVEAKLLERNFKDMQRAFHPDLFANRSADEQEVSSTNSTMANKAYQTLVHPMRRVKYLMRLLGVSVSEESDEERPPVPAEFLMEVMDTRERLERCSSMKEAESVLAETTAAIQDCLRTMDVVLRAGGGKDELTTPAIRIRYFFRIEEEARNVLHHLEDAHSGSSER